MTRISIALSAVAALLLVSGCGVDEDRGRSNEPETILVTDQLGNGQGYNIDLTQRAIYILPPNSDASHLSVTCPSLLTISFSEYVLTRIGPTGVKYDPTSDVLRVANGAIPLEASVPVLSQLAGCWVDCSDPVSSMERCMVDCVAQE